VDDGKGITAGSICSEGNLRVVEGVWAH
jgi:hypothetical protein